jgi:hypothetical protein
VDSIQCPRCNKYLQNKDDAIIPNKIDKKETISTNAKVDKEHILKLDNDTDIVLKVNN